MTAEQLTYKVFPVLPCHVDDPECSDEFLADERCPLCLFHGTRLGKPVATVVRSDWVFHPTPDGRRWMSPHGDSGLHMGGCHQAWIES